MDPNDRMNPNMPVQLFLDDPPCSSSSRKRPRSPSRSPSREREIDIDPVRNNDFDQWYRRSPQRQGLHQKEEWRHPKGDGRFFREPELIFCGRRRRNLASTLCDLTTHFLRTAANIVVHRFSNYGNGDPAAFVDKTFQGRIPYKFCTIREVRDYIDTSMYGIRDELRPQRVESVCFAIVNDLEESLVEVTVDFLQTALFRNRRLRGVNPKPVEELRDQLSRALQQLQQLRLKPRVHRKLMRTRTSLTIRYATIDGKAGEEDDENIPDGWEGIWPTPPDYAQVLHPWVEPIANEFNQMEFHVYTCW